MDDLKQELTEVPWP